MADPIKRYSPGFVHGTWGMAARAGGEYVRWEDHEREISEWRGRASRAEARFAELEATVLGEVAEFNAGYEAALRGDREDSEPSDTKHDQWRVGYAWQQYHILKSRLSAAEARVAELEAVRAAAHKEGA